MTDGNHVKSRDRAGHSPLAYADTEAPDSCIGTTVEKYRIIRLLGRGAMGSGHMSFDAGSAAMPPDSASVAEPVAALSELPVNRPAQAAPSALSPTASAAPSSNEVRTKFEVVAPTSNNAPATRGRAAQLRPTESAAPSVTRTRRNRPKECRNNPNQAHTIPFQSIPVALTNSQSKRLVRLAQYLLILP